VARSYITSRSIGKKPTEARINRNSKTKLNCIGHTLRKPPSDDIKVTLEFRGKQEKQRPQNNMKMDSGLKCLNSKQNHVANLHSGPFSTEE
jgi:hypothetical protein